MVSFLQEKIDTLASLGGDPSELSFWSMIYKYLPENTQKEVLNNIEKEIKLLQEIK